jgi:serine/threonine-protein kinase
LSAEELSSLLLEYNFYATCWTYNIDFCNPNGEFENDYVDNGDGTVTDRRTGLMWQKGGSSEPLSWGKALEYVKELNREAFAGHSDWRLPTVPELASLMERSWENEDLFISPVFESVQRYCWSADTRGVEKAWKANFHLGFILDFPMTDQNSVRAVRSINRAE